MLFKIKYTTVRRNSICTQRNTIFLFDGLLIGILRMHALDDVDPSNK